MKEIHGHDVLNMMLDSGLSYTRQSLAEAIIQRFGAEARFHTCSAENLTAAELVEFLETKGKFIPQPDGGINTSPDLICKHG
jgi:probable metal-binding protein